VGHVEGSVKVRQKDVNNKPTIWEELDEVSVLSIHLGRSEKDGRVNIYMHIYPFIIVATCPSLCYLDPIDTIRLTVWNDDGFSQADLDG